MNYEEVFKLGNNIKGAYVELGFGSGHSAKLIAGLLKSDEIANRSVWIFDSFKGLPTPTDKDLEYDSTLRAGKFSKPVQPALDLRFDIPKVDYKVIRGYVEDTVTQFTEEFISILNVDLSTYSSTKKALESLHKFVPRNGVVLVPAYGINEGVKAAVDEFLAANNLSHQNKGTGYFINTPPKQFLVSKLQKDTTFKEQEVPKKHQDEPVPYADRYKKKTPKKLDYKKEIKKGLKVINKIVTR